MPILATNLVVILQSHRQVDMAFILITSIHSQNQAFWGQSLTKTRAKSIR